MIVWCGSKVVRPYAERLIGFCKSFGVIVGVAAVLQLLYTLYASFYFIQLPWIIDEFGYAEALLNTVQAAVVSVVGIMFVIGGGILFVKMILNRAQTIGEQTGEEYTVIPMFCEVQRLVGDLGLTSGLIGAAGGLIQALLSFIGGILYVGGFRLIPATLLMTAPQLARDGNDFFNPWQMTLGMAEEPWTYFLIALAVTAGSFIAGVFFSDDYVLVR